MCRLRPRHLLSLAFAAALGVACTPTPSQPDDGPLTPPFVVSDHFAATGYMGDGATVGLVNMVNDACPTRSPGPNGDCYKVTYTPVQGWAGVNWQYPANNWGAYQGRTILPGATKVTVWARGENGGEKLTFQVGGNHDDTVVYHDSIDAETAATLTTDWQQFTINFGPKTYDQEIDAFAWVAHAQPGQSTIVFYLDAITWET
jgi:hypothetical protein